MSKKPVVWFLVILFFSSNLAYADIVINEVKLSPTSERFIELYNSGGSAVDLAGWYMQRKTATGSSFGSLVSNPNFEGKTIGPGDYFVISRSALDSSDIILDSLTLTDSNTIQIKNSSGDVVDKVGWGSSTDCGSPCPPNPAEGQSIQRTTSGWVAAAPTPGDANETVSAPPQNAGGNTDAPDDSVSLGSADASSGFPKAGPKEKPKVIENPTMKAKIMASAAAFVGQPVSMQANITGLQNESVASGRVYWNFGDGVSWEQIDNFGTFNHIYYHPGEYALFLEYYKRKNYSKTPDAAAKMVIKVLPTAVTISRVGDAEDFFVELSNDASSDIDVSNWVLNASGKIFILPLNSVIMSKKQMTISGKTTGFTYGDRYNLKLFSSTGEMVFDYSNPPLLVEEGAGGGDSKKNHLALKGTPPRKGGEESALLPEPKTEIPAENLEALAGDGGIAKDNSGNFFLPSLISVIFIGASAGAVYFIRKKRPASGSDFKILDE